MSESAALIHREARPGFVRELCVALRHRWEPEALFLILTAYLDESGTHGVSPVTVMSGLFGSARQWEQFECRIAKIQKLYGFKIYHGKEFKAHTGEFGDWTARKYSDLIDDLTDIAGNDLAHGVSITLNNDQYQREYRAGPKPRKMILDSKYGLCFRFCLRNLIEEAWKRRPASKTRPHKVHIVLERGHPNLGDADRIFAAEKKRLLERGFDILGTITSEEKEDCYPLMISDFLAHTSYVMEIDKDPIIGAAQDRETRYRNTYTKLTFEPGVLVEVKADFERLREKRMAEWRARKITKGGA